MGWILTKEMMMAKRGSGKKTTGNLAPSDTGPTTINQAEAEADVVMVLIMLNQANHHEFHSQLRRVRVRTHQVETGQVMAVGR